MVCSLWPLFYFRVFLQNSRSSISCFLYPLISRNQNVICHGGWFELWTQYPGSVVPLAMFFNFPNGSCFIHFSRYFFKNLKILKNSKIFPKKLWFKGHVENQKIAISYLGMKMALVWEYFQKFIHFGQRKRPYGRLKESGKIVLTEFVMSFCR